MCPQKVKATDAQLIESYGRLKSVNRVGAEFGMDRSSVYARLQKLGAIMDHRQTRECSVCSAEFISTQEKQKYCSYPCRRKAASITPSKSWDERLPPGTVGEIGELKVAVDLLSKGYHVFKALSPSSVCDLLVRKGDELVSVEVKTGNDSMARNPERAFQRYGNADVLAIVDYAEDKIIYYPDRL